MFSQLLFFFINSVQTITDFSSLENKTLIILEGTVFYTTQKVYYSAGALETADLDCYS